MEHVGTKTITVSSNYQVPKWGNDLLHVILRDRVVDANFKRLIISSDKVYIYEKHFSESQIYTCKYAKLLFLLHFLYYL